LFLFDELLEHVSQEVITGSVFETIAEDLAHELREFARVVEADVLEALALLGCFDRSELLVLVDPVVDFEAWHGTATNHEDQEVKERYQIVSPACRVELQLVETREYHVAAEGIDLLLVHMLLCLFVDVPGGKSKIDHVHLIAFKDVSGGLLQFLAVFAIVKEQIIKLKVVVDVSSLVNPLEHVEKLDAQRVYRLSREMTVPALEKALKIYAIPWHYQIRHDNVLWNIFRWLVGLHNDQ